MSGPSLNQRRAVRRAWAALGGDAAARRAVQMAAACGVAVFTAAGEEGGAAAMRHLLDACMAVERKGQRNPCVAGKRAGRRDDRLERRRG